MYVCNCNAITERQVRSAVREGATSVRKLRDELGVATGCGKCASHARCVIESTIIEDQLAQQCSSERTLVIKPLIAMSPSFAA